MKPIPLEILAMLNWHYIAPLLFVALVLLALTGCRTVPPVYPDTNPMAPPAAASRFDRAEAMAMIEFCIDLDNQDDRNSPNARNIDKLRSDRISDWRLIDDSRVRYADAAGLTAAARTDPLKNGFPPFGSAWTLWENAAATARGERVFALAFRGTVFSYKPSVVEDALSTTVAGRHGMELPAGRFLNLTFAALPRAEVHEGFAYGVFSQLFDNEFGVLARIRNEIPAGSTLIITGHSQGAALATLAHAFLYYAAQEGRFGVPEMKLTLRSYVFAQPKPGNTQFAMDFAGITGGGATSFTLNNTLDAVPMLPPTHSFLFGAFEDCPPGRNPAFEFVRAVNNFMNRFSRSVSGFSEDSVAGRINKLQKKDADSFYASDQLPADPGFRPASAVSQDYATVGNLIPLIGLHNGASYYGWPSDAADEFIQHHATTYRRLLETMFGAPPTTEATATLAMPPGIGPGK
jgi:hypothetical protein